MAKTFYVYVPALFRQQFFVGIREIFHESGGYGTIMAPFCRPLSMSELRLLEREFERLLTEYPKEEELWAQLQVLGAVAWPPTSVIEGVQEMRQQVRNSIAQRRKPVRSPD